MGMLLSLSLTSCREEDPPSTFTGNIDPVTSICFPDAPTLSSWTFKIGDMMVLRHTAGLATMAITGDVTELNDEWCRTGERGVWIPKGLGDDIHEVGYAPQILLGDYVIAMYHPIREAPDHFITWNIIDGSWIHWKLGASPTIIIQS